MTKRFIEFSIYIRHYLPHRKKHIATIRHTITDLTQFERDVVVFLNMTNDFI